METARPCVARAARARKIARPRAARRDTRAAGTRESPRKRGEKEWQRAPAEGRGLRVSAVVASREKKHRHERRARSTNAPLRARTGLGNTAGGVRRRIIPESSSVTQMCQCVWKSGWDCAGVAHLHHPLGDAREAKRWLVHSCVSPDARIFVGAGALRFREKHTPDRPGGRKLRGSHLGPRRSPRLDPWSSIATRFITRVCTRQRAPAAGMHAVDALSAVGHVGPFRAHGRAGGRSFESRRPARVRSSRRRDGLDPTPAASS